MHDETTPQTTPVTPDVVPSSKVEDTTDSKSAVDSMNTDCDCGAVGDEKP